LGLENRKRKKNHPDLKIPPSILKNIHLIRHIRCPVPSCGHQGKKPSWYTSLKVTDSFLAIFFWFLQCPAKLVRRNRLIKPAILSWLPSLSHFLRLDCIFAGTYSTSPENHTRFMSQALLYPTRSLLISLLDLPFKRRTSVRLSLPILFNVAHLCPFKPVVMLCTSQATPPLRLQIRFP
jgi:hypothetical protein